MSASDGREAPLYERLKRAIEELRPAVVVTAMGEASGGKALFLFDPDPGAADVERAGSLGAEWLDEFAGRAARERLAAERSATVEATGPDGVVVKLFVEVFPPPPMLLIFGAVHVGQALCRLAKQLGYHVVVSDARGALATEERFPEADRIVQGWPDDALKEVAIGPTAAIAILTHDPKFDEPAIVGALGTRARYIGAVGSRKTNEDRRARLAEAGVSAEQVARVRGPIGLNIGAESPEEMAVAILAEIIAVKYGRPGGALATASGRIRGDPGERAAE